MEAEQTVINTSRIAYLISRYIGSVISRHELQELEAWMADSTSRQLLFAELLLGWQIKGAGVTK